MKKMLFLFLMFFCILTLHAGTFRNYFQKVVAADPSIDILTLVTSTLTSYMAPNYVVHAWMLERPGEVLGTDLGTATTGITLRRTGNGTTVPYYAIVLVQIGLFPTPWVAGNTLHIHVTKTNESPVQTTEWDQLIPTGTSIINITDPVKEIPPFLFTYFNPQPADTPTPLSDATDISQSLSEISWNYTHSIFYTDPDHFQVLFGTSSDLIGASIINVVGGVGSNSCSLPTLTYMTDYYWQVVPYSGALAAEGCPIWHFQTGSRITWSEAVSEPFAWDTADPEIDIINPEATAVWFSYTEKTVDYSASDANLTDNSVNMQYSITNGITWLDLLNQSPYSGSFQWTIPLVSYSVVARLKLQVTDSFGNMSEKTRNFQIDQFATLSTPQNLDVSVQGDNALVTWDPTTTNVLGDAITPDFYLVFFNAHEINDPAHFYFLDYTPNLTYMHHGVARFSQRMFYHIVAYKDYSRSGTTQLADFKKGKKDITYTELVKLLDGGVK